MAERPAQREQDLLRIANLMAHPTAGIMAASALGVGLASHAFGFWMGAMSGAAEAMGKLMASVDEPLAEPRTRASERAEATTKTLIARVKRVANQVAEASPSNVYPLITKPLAAPVEAKTAPAANEGRWQPQPIEKPRKPDDLKLIAGIGPKLETVLNGLGIWTYAQIVAWAPVEIAWMDDHLGFSGRIARDNWIEQAAALAGKRRR